MSRAFVKEDDGGGRPEIPERPHSVHPALITPAGFEALECRYEALLEERRRIAGAGPESAEALPSLDRDLRYVRSRIERAVVVREPQADRDRVGFGATVEVRREDGAVQTFTLVGEDEAEPRAGRVSWTSPLGQALLGAKIGDTVVWVRPAGELHLSVESTKYSESQSIGH